jgi:hypothetical protein
MSNPTLFISNDKCDILMVNFNEITGLEWKSWYTNADTAIEIFVVFKTGPEINKIATKITKNDIYGDVYFVKICQGKWINIDYSDIPGLIDILMSSMTLSKSETPVSEMQDAYDYYDPDSMWDDGWNDGWRTPTGYDSC